MTPQIKNIIIDWFKKDRSFETGKQLFIKHGSSMSFKITLNRAGNTPDNYKFLCYELAKLAGLTESQYKNFLKVPLMKAISEETRNTKIDINDLSPEEILDQIASVNLDDLTYNTARAVMKIAEVKVEKPNKAKIFAVLADMKKARVLVSVPVEVKRSFKLREEFPFLKQKDCPPILKELVADMLTAYDNFIEGHQKMVGTMDEETINSLSKEVVENYLENRQIWEELNHYKEKGELLGNHPLFEWIGRRNEITDMKTADLVQLQKQLENKIPRTKKKIADEPDHKETENRQKRVEQFELELSLVKKLLGITGDEK